MNLYINDEEVQIIHVNKAHTDDNSIIYFKGSNVIHMGGSINGMISAVEMALTLSNRQTKAIAGHGPVGDTEGLKRYLIMLKSAHRIISNEKNKGRVSATYKKNLTLF